MISPSPRNLPVALRELTVVATSDLSPRMRRITLSGDQLGAFEAEGVLQPAMQCHGPDDHVRLFFPDPVTGTLSLPRQGTGRLHWPQDPPAISRVYTPRAFAPARRELVLDFVRHGNGIAGSWAESAVPGMRIHVAGPKSSMPIRVARRYLLLGDETALPALANWLDMLPADADVAAHLLISDPAARLSLIGPHAGSVSWHHGEPSDATIFLRLAGAATPDCFVWAAGERSAMTALQDALIRSGHPKGMADVTNYWIRDVADPH